MAPNRKERESREEARSGSMRAFANEVAKGGSSTLKLPAGVEQVKLEVGQTYEVDFMPWLAGDNNPRADNGYPVFVRSYEMHWVPFLGRNKPVCCRRVCFKQKCAVCDWLNQFGQRADSKLVDSLRPKVQHLWLWNIKPGGKKPVWRVLDSNNKNRGHGFAEQMSDAINDLPEGVEPFPLKGGYTARIVAKEGSWPGGKYTYASRITLTKREYDYPEDLLEEAPCLDGCLVDPGYAEIWELLTNGEGASPTDDDRGGDEDALPRRRSSREDDDDNGRRATARKSDGDDDDDDRPAKPSSKKPAEKTAEECGIKDGAIVFYKDEECEVVKISGDGTSITLEGDDGRMIKGVAPEECTPRKSASQKNGKASAKPAAKAAPPDEDEDEDEAPPKRSAKKPPADEDEDEDDQIEDEDEDEDEDEEAPAKPAKRGKK